MSIRVEFYGIARARAGLSSIDVAIPGRETTLADLLHRMAAEAPALGDHELLKNGRLHSSLTVNLDGQRFISDPATPVRDGQCLLVLSADAGG